MWSLPLGCIPLKKCFLIVSPGSLVVGARTCARGPGLAAPAAAQHPHMLARVHDPFNTGAAGPQTSGASSGLFRGIEFQCAQQAARLV